MSSRRARALRVGATFGQDWRDVRYQQKVAQMAKAYRRAETSGARVGLSLQVTMLTVCYQMDRSARSIRRFMAAWDAEGNMRKFRGPSA